MKRIDGELYLEMDDLRASGIDESTALMGKLRGSKIWVAIKDPACLTKSLYHFESMGDKYKKMIWQNFGDPYVYAITQPIKKMVVKDFAAHSFYISYRLNNESLRPEQIENYTIAASWLNMLANITAQVIKKELKISAADFYKQVGAIIKAEGIKLPSSYRHLMPAIEAYKSQGYEYLIDGRLGNTNRVKVADELSQSILFEMVAHPNQYDDLYISWQYNAWAKTNNYEPITAATVGNYRRRYYHMLQMQREGNDKYVKAYGKSIKGFRPTQPTFLWESDDNHTDFYFVNWEDNTNSKFYNTFKMMVVTDSFNDLVLGYAVGKEITTDLVLAAYRNAMLYVKKLTGNWHLPHETKTDRWGLKKLQPFYESIGHYAVTPVGSKNRGYIEQFFGSAHWERCIKVGSNNYNGRNITAKNAGVNREVLHANRKDFPTVEQAPQYFADFVYRLRTMPQGAGKPSKQDEWLAAYNQMPADKKRCIGNEEYLLKFGIEKPETNQITTAGITLGIDNRKYNFEIPDEFFYQYKGCSLYTYYDPACLDMVLLTDKNSIRFTAQQTQLHGRAMADMKPGDRTYINERLAGRQAHVQQVADAIQARKNALNQAGVSIEKLLTEGMLLKEDRTAAIELVQQRELEYSQPQPRRIINPIDKM